MSALWTPPKVSRELREGTRGWEACVKSVLMFHGTVQDHWNVELKKIDPNLRLVRAYDNATDVAGVMAGFYHLVRLRDPMTPGMLLIVPLRGPSGEFIEPSSGMLDGLRACDLQNERVNRARQADAERTAASIERAAAREEEERIDEGVERYNAAFRTQILTSLDVPYSQTNSATARRDRGQRAK